jgi:hypothetical protein
MRVFILFALLLSAAGVAHASEFAVRGRDCIPDSSTLTNQLINTSFGGPTALSWSYASPPKTGTITVYCPIPLNMTAPSNLEFAFTNDNSCSGCLSDGIIVTYLKMNKVTGVVSTVAQATTAGGGNVGGWEFAWSAFSDAYDPVLYAYFLRVEMIRVTVNNSNTMQYIAMW